NTQGCTPPTHNSDGPPLHVGCFYKEISTAGGDLDHSHAVPPLMTSGSLLTGAGGQGTGGVGSIDVTVPLTQGAGVSLTNVSRYVCEREYVSGYDLITWAVDRTGTNAQKLRVQ